MPTQHLWSLRACEDYMSTIAFDSFPLTRIADFARTLSRLHKAARHRFIDDDAVLTDWWGFCWMILAEKRRLLTPENRAASRAAIEEKYLMAPNVIGVIVGR